MNTKLYLNRIGVEKIKDPTLVFLTELQNHHLLTIPFEDLDIPYRSRIELNLEKIYNKIIPTKRGGFCYELNGLFYWLLNSLGFKVDMLSARTFDSHKKDFGPEYDHMTLLVHLNEDYLVDVGFGDTFRNPIVLPDGKTKDVSGCYKIFKVKENLFELQRKNNGEFMQQYCFTTIPRELDDFKEMCTFHQDSPDSKFRNRMLCTIATNNGRITLINNSLIITNNGRKTKEEFAEKENFYFLLKKHFGIELKL